MEDVADISIAKWMLTQPVEIDWWPVLTELTKIKLGFDVSLLSEQYAGQQ